MEKVDQKLRKLMKIGKIPRLVQTWGKIPRYPDECQKPRSSEKNLALVTLAATAKTSNLESLRIRHCQSSRVVVNPFTHD